MGNFNVNDTQTRKTVTYEGGESYTKQLDDAWTNLIFSYLLNSRSADFYETADTRMSRYIELTKEMIDKRGAEFVAKAAHYSRNELGLRTISELTAAILNSYQFENKRKFYANYFRRPDGIGEVFSAIDMLEDKRSHALVRGAKDYLETLNEYQMGKYKMSGKKYNLHDIINICHPKSDVADKYQRGTLEVPDTWETAISASTSAEEKSKTWKRLVEERKLGYLALLRNLKNICATSFADYYWVKEHIKPQLVNEEAIKKSLVFPYQIYVAYENCKDWAPACMPEILDEAFRLSVQNCPEFEGKSAIILDVSGSMTSYFGTYESSITILGASACYAVAMHLKNPDVEIVKFGTEAKFAMKPPTSINVFSQIEYLCRNEGLGHGTQLHKVYELFESNPEQFCDRWFLFSDMQIMEHGDSYGFDEFCKACGDVTVYSFDLGNYPSQITSDDRRLHYITSLTDKVFEFIKRIDSGESLIKVISAYNY